MARFLTSLDVRRLEDSSRDGRGTWLLLAPLIFHSEVLAGLVNVRPGFVTDFASLPWFVPVGVLGAAAPAAAVLHDDLYSHPHRTSRATADAILREACIACGMKTWKAWLMWAGPRIGGAGSWRAPNTPQPVEAVN